MSNIPQARKELLALADMCEASGDLDTCDEIRAIVGLHLKRRSPIRKAPVHSKTVTPELAADIRHFAKNHPHLSQMTIASTFGVNSGRVSEAMRHLR
jgi:hypothetical protein